MEKSPIWTNKAKLALACGGILAVGAMGLRLLWHHAKPTGPPPPATQVITPPAINSKMVVPVVADLSQLQRLLDREIPVDLCQIDEPDRPCAAPQHLHLFGERLAITPSITCHITGKAVRGAIVLHGAGQQIIADVPIFAHVEARTVGGLVGAHADGRAMAHARVRLTLAPNWQVGSTMSLSYDWNTPPAIELLGLRIPFADKADERLKPVIARLERDLPARLASLDFGRRIAAL